MTKRRSWWRQLFTDHPGLAEQLLGAYTSGGRPRIWCTACLQRAIDLYMREGHPSINVVWDDAVFCEKLCVQGRGWIPYRPTTCWKHLSDCPSQTDEFRQKAQEALGRHNARRRDKAQDSSARTHNLRMTSVTLPSPADPATRASTRGSADRLNGVPTPRNAPSATQVEASLPVWAACGIYPGYPPDVHVINRSLQVDSSHSNASLTLERRDCSSSAGGAPLRRTRLPASHNHSWHATVAGGGDMQGASPFNEDNIYLRCLSRANPLHLLQSDIRERSPGPFQRPPADPYAAVAMASSFSNARTDLSSCRMEYARSVLLDSPLPDAQDVVPDNGLQTHTHPFRYQPAYSTPHDAVQHDNPAQPRPLFTSVTDRHAPVITDLDPVGFDAWLHPYQTASVLCPEHDSLHSCR